MSRRETWLTAALVFAVAVVVRIWAAGTITFPRPEDTAYYVGVARNLVEGRGLVSDALWSFGTPPLVFPRPAFEVWLPLPAFLAAIPMALLGTTFAAAQWAGIVVGGLVAVLAWRLGADVAAERGLEVERARTLALGTGLSAAVFLPLVLHSVLPDSTMPFGALVLAACLLAARVVRDPRGARLADPRVLTLGVVLGLSALTRNEAVWLALAWVMVARGAAATAGAGTTGWARLVAGAAIPAMIVFAPWAIRDWAEFGSPFPGQALTNALSLDGRDIFAWRETPTLRAYLEAGPGTLLGLRWTGFFHNVTNVLLLMGIPVSAIGLASLPWTWRGTALAMLVRFSALTFGATTILFPVATTWGTFLHASAAVQVLLVVAALLALDGVIATIGRRRGWTRPVAWLGPFLAVAAGGLFTTVLLPEFGADGAAARARFAALPAALEAAGAPIQVAGVPVITDTPIWLAEETGAFALALPDESPESVLDLARHFRGTTLVIVAEDNAGIWPEIALRDPTGRRCFEPVALIPAGSIVVPDDPLRGLRVFRIVCA